MSAATTANDVRSVVLGIVGAVALVALLTLGWLYLVQPRITDQRGDIFRDSYGSEVARVDAARQAVVALGSATDGQRAALVNQACALIADTQEVPSDLAAFAAKEC